MTDAPVPLAREDERLWATLTHVSALVGIVLGVGFLGWLGPLIIWLVFRERSAFVVDHARNTLSFQLTMLIASFVAALLWIVLVGFVVTAAVYVVVIVFSIVGAVRANRGERYRYPLTIPFFR